jgi:exodeoxyribonuclease-3
MESYAPSLPQHSGCGKLGGMKLAAWNVNSLKVRLPQLLDFLATRQPDVVCLQETKLIDDAFPVADLETAGYRVAFAGQKTYNGVAIVSRKELADIQIGIPGLEDEQKRVIAATVGGIRVVCVYCPNGQSLDSDKYPYKLAWFDALAAWLKDELVRHPKLAVLGDYNVAPEDRDVHDPEAWKDSVLVSEPERERFRALLALGLKDSFRLFEQPEKTFSWWDYRMMGFRRNHGLRIDHILLSEPLATECKSSTIDRDMRKLERPSDHAPVVAEISLTS